jgi:formylglycine-generating enzyme
MSNFGKQENHEMHRQLAIVVASFVVLATADARAVTMAWSPVGNPGNAADTVMPNPGFGAVPYAYNIGTYDVTNSQYVEFLNSNDPNGTSPLGLYNSLMSDPILGGITYTSGAASGSKYSVMGTRGQNPVISVNFYDTLRFANWLDNGQVAGMTETGAYTLLGGTAFPSNHATITRTDGAAVFLPSENEWYKAAYYDPRTTAQGGPPLDSHYWLYPTSSNAIPNASAPTATPNSANYNMPVNGSLTAVGAYTGTTSPYGAFDMGGDVSQWNESFLVSHGAWRGSFFALPSIGLLSSARLATGNPFEESESVGFRVAMIPEPSSFVLGAIGIAGLAAWGWRRSKPTRS